MTEHTLPIRPPRTHAEITDEKTHDFGYLDLLGWKVRVADVQPHRFGATE